MEQLRQLADQLTQAIETALQDVAALRREQEHLKASELANTQREKRLGVGEEQLRKDQAVLVQEKAFLKQGLEKLEQQKAIEARIDEKRTLLATESETIKTERDKAAAKLLELQEALQAADQLTKDQETLAEKERVLKGIEAQQHKRRLALDQQEEANRREATRLQRIAERF